MLDSPAVRQLEDDIRREYAARLVRHPDNGDLGWRLLYSPARVLSGARIAFVGLNPGGASVDPTHGVFSSEKGSAYCKDVEDWKTSSGLQDQVLALFNLLDVQPDDVLAGNLIPFRSRDEASLPGEKEAFVFGRNLWKQIFRMARPSVVVTMGQTANREVSQLLGVVSAQRYEVGWGRCCASRGQFDGGGTWIGLPHLSRFKIMKRKASRAALDALFDGISEK
ncbi:uracil-DNA glycosylase family protein [uncultured Roseibium sp.]|uniref:uracil-DNA glycosylase family protein n=1 Tax=uncultured Roseibium sp. TaxID=1936171 RepID=UPI003217D1D4